MTRTARNGWWVTALVGIVGSLSLGGCSDGESDAPPPNEAPANEPTGVDVSATDGRIVFQRYDPSTDGPVTYTVNADGSDLRPLYRDGNSETARWSPDGDVINIFCCDAMVAHLIEPDSGQLRGLPPPDPALETHCGFAWTPDGDRLACEVFGLDDPNLTGVYSIRASDGGDLTQITSNPGGDDIPGDYAPDGSRMVFGRVEAQDPDDIGLYVINVDGTTLTKISDDLVDFSPGRWSPTGDQILFAARRSQDHHKTIWIVDADGGSPRELPIDPTCGGLWSDPEAVGCYAPAWSPDGAKIVYVRSTPEGDDEGLYVANADGSGSVRLTEGEDDQPDWGAPIS